MSVASLYVSLLAANMASTHLRFVVGSSFGEAWITLYCLSTSLQTNLIWLCLFSVRCISVGLVWLFNKSRRSKIVLCTLLY